MSDIKVDAALDTVKSIANLQPGDTACLYVTIDSNDGEEISMSVTDSEATDEPEEEKPKKPSRARDAMMRHDEEDEDEE